MRLWREKGAGWDAEDLAQETMLRALRGLRSFDSSRPIGPWLKAIAARLILDNHRRGAREAAASVVDDVIPSHAGLESENSDARMDVVRAIRRLPDRYQRALVLHYFADRTQSESAEILGLSVDCFKQTLLRARRTLAAQLHAERYRRA